MIKAFIVIMTVIKRKRKTIKANKKEKLFEKLDLKKITIDCRVLLLLQHLHIH